MKDRIKVRDLENSIEIINEKVEKQTELLEQAVIALTEDKVTSAEVLRENLLTLVKDGVLDLESKIGVMQRKISDIRDDIYELKVNISINRKDN